MAYPTLANLKTNLRITDSSEDAVLQLKLDEAVAWVEEFTGRNFSGTPITVTDEQYDLDTLTQSSDNMYIQLQQMDIVTVPTVKLGDVAIGAGDFKFTPEGRLLIFGRMFDVSRRAYTDLQYAKVSYTYGASTPKTIEGAVLMLAMTYWNDRLALANSSATTGIASEASSNTVKGERVGEYSVTYGGGNTSATSGADNLKGGNDKSTGTINSISRTLNQYRKRRV